MSKTTLESILGVFTKLHISARLSVCPSAQNNSPPTKRIFTKRHFGIFTNICRHILLLVRVEKWRVLYMCVTRSNIYFRDAVCAYEIRSVSFRNLHEESDKKPPGWYVVNPPLVVVNWRSLATSSQNFDNNEFCVLHLQSNTTIFLPISTVRIQLHVSVLYVDHLQVEIFNLQFSYTRCVGHLGGRGDEISLFQ